MGTSTPSPAIQAPTGQVAAIYTAADLQAELRQGEILSDVYEARFDENLDSFVEIKRDFVVVASQDCDLYQDYNRFLQKKSEQLLGVLLYEGKKADAAQSEAGGSDLWKPISQNKNERFHLFEQVDPEFDLLTTGVPALVIDFKRVFTLPYVELRRQISQFRTNRRTRLVSPYLEHFAVRVSAYYQRVGVPTPHKFPR